MVGNVLFKHRAQWLNRLAGAPRFSFRSAKAARRAEYLNPTKEEQRNRLFGRKAPVPDTEEPDAF
jgi:hypothetical protein